MKTSVGRARLRIQRFSRATQAVADRGLVRAGHTRFSAMIDTLIASLTAEEAYHRGQAKGLLWASVRLPEENMDDPHFQARGTFQPIPSPELGRDLLYPVSAGTDGKDRVTAFHRGTPRLGEHTREVLAQAGFSSAEISALAAEGAI